MESDLQLTARQLTILKKWRYLDVGLCASCPRLHDQHADRQHQQAGAGHAENREKEGRASRPAASVAGLPRQHARHLHLLDALHHLRAQHLRARHQVLWQTRVHLRDLQTVLQTAGRVTNAVATIFGMTFVGTRAPHALSNIVACVMPFPARDRQ